MGMLLVLVIMGVVFYFFLIRPQRKRQGEHRNFVDGLQKGDKVITIGGLYGEVDYVGEQEVVLKTEDGGKLKFLKTSIMGKQATEDILPKE